MGILLEVHRTGYVVVDPDTEKKGDQYYKSLFSEVVFPEPVFKAKNVRKCRLPESTLFNRIRKYSFERFGEDALTLCESTPFVSVSAHPLVQKSRVFPPLFCGNYFRKESTLLNNLQKSVPFS